MVSHSLRGRRLLPAEIDRIAAQEPCRPWASVPIDLSNVTKGFKDVTFQEFGNAIDRAAHWLDAQLGKAGSDYPTFSYAGPKDLRYPILTVAAAKVGRRILLVSPWARTQAQRYLLEVMNCTHVLYAGEVSHIIEEVITAEERDLRETVEVPSLTALLKEDTVCRPYPYIKTWAEACNDPWVIFHTSGTTADPKPLVYTQLCFCSMDAYDVMRDPDTKTITDQYRGSRLFTPFPAMHLGGMICMLQLPVWLQTVSVIGPDSRDYIPIMNAVLEYGKATGMLLTPAYVEALTDQPGYEARLGALKYLQYGGAPLPKHIGDRIPAHVKLQPIYGSTEAGICKMIVREDNEWEYCSFMSSDGIHFEPIDEGVCMGQGRYELVFRRETDPFALLYQQVFQIFPGRKVFRTKDLFVPHPTRSGLWKYVGRADDMIKFKHGESLRADVLEGILTKHDCIRTAVIGGKGRPSTCALLELSQNSAGLEHSAKLDLVTKAIKEVNRNCSKLVHLQRELILFVSSEKPLPRNLKGAVMRDAAFNLYSEQIDTLYDAMNLPN